MRARWAQRCQQAATLREQIQFAIVQGGLDENLRVWSAEALAKLDFPGYAIGGIVQTVLAILWISKGLIIFKLK